MKRFVFSPAQLKELEFQRAEVLSVMASIRFDDSVQDQERIRQHVYNQARFDLLNEMIEDDYPQPEPENSNGQSSD